MCILLLLFKRHFSVDMKVANTEKEKIQFGIRQTRQNWTFNFVNSFYYANLYFSVHL